MEDHSPKIVTTIEPNEDVEEVPEELEPVPEESILKAKKPRSKAQMDAFSKCQARRRELIQKKRHTRR